MALKLSLRESACCIKSEGFVSGNLGHLGGDILHRVSSVLKSKVQEVKSSQVKM